MAIHNKSSGEEVETDATFYSLETVTQRAAALRIQQLAGKFPWEIVDFCTETKWDIKLLDRFAALIHTCFPGKLSDLDTKRLRTAIFQQIEPKAIKKRTFLSQSDVQEVQRELRRSGSQQAQRESHHETSPQTPTTASKATANRKRRSSSTSKSSTAASYKRIRVEEESPHVVATRSSKRLRGEPTDTPLPAEAKRSAIVRDPYEKQSAEVSDIKSDGEDYGDDEDNKEEEQPDEDTPVDDQNDERENQKQEQNEQESDGIEVAGNSESTIDGDHGKDSPTEYHDVAELILDSGPPSETSVNKTPAPQALSTPRSSPTIRKAFVVELSMTDKEIADRFRKNVSFIASKLQFINNKEFKEQEVEERRCQEEYDKACDLASTVADRFNETTTAYMKVKEELEKLAFRREKTAAALAPYKELKAVGGSVTQIFDMLEAALKEAEFDHRKCLEDYTTLKEKVNTLLKELDDVTKSQARTKAKRDEATQLKTDFVQNQSSERKFQCSIRMATDARNEDGHLFGDLIFDLGAIARQRQGDVDSD